MQPEGRGQTTVVTLLAVTPTSALGSCGSHTKPVDHSDGNSGRRVAPGAAPRVEGQRPEPLDDRPEGWPERCGRCGASWEHIGFDYADGFNCRACGGCDSDE